MNKVWLVSQNTKNGCQYYTNKAHPISPDAWTRNINKAHRFDWQQVVNMREWVSAHTWGESIQIVKD
jgi:hypothetical protein